MKQMILGFMVHCDVVPPILGKGVHLDPLPWILIA